MITVNPKGLSLTLPKKCFIDYFPTKSFNIDKIKHYSDLLSTDSDTKTITIATNTEEDICWNIDNEKVLSELHASKKIEFMRKQKFSLYGIHEVAIQTDISFNSSIAHNMSSVNEKRRVNKPKKIIGKRKIPEHKLEHQSNTTFVKLRLVEEDGVRGRLLINKILKNDV